MPNTHTFKFPVIAPTPSEAETVLDHLATINENVTDINELAVLAKLTKELKNKKGWISKAAAYKHML